MIYLMLVFLTLFLTQAYYFWAFKRVEKKARHLIEEKVDEVIDTLKGEIPMAQTFLSGSLDQRLRSKAKGLVSTLLPTLKRTLSFQLIFIPYVGAGVLFLAFWAISKML